jgi:hypothetical protein
MTAIALALALAAQAGDPRDLQWLYRDRQGDGQERPAAVFLWWDYSHVIFHASCDPERPDTLRLRYFPGHAIGTRDDSGHVVLDPVPPIVLKRGSLSLTMETGLLWDSIVGRARITPALLALLRPAPDTGLGVDAINETGDDWDTGAAEPLHRLALACDDAER